MQFYRGKFMKQNQDISLETLQQLYKTNVAIGLSTQEAKSRLHTYGLNALPEAKQETWVVIFLRQFQNPLIYILLAAALIIFFVGESKLDAFIILGVLCFNAIVGAVQEGRTRSILQTLKRFIATNCIVLRDGKKILVVDTQLVPGDIILLQEGQKVPADAYVLESNALQVDEAILTGESRPVYKVSCIADQYDVALKNHMLCKGTHVLSGSGRALVYATGVTTEIGKINKELEEIDTNMPLKREMDRLSFWLLIGVLGVCSIFFVMGFIAGQPLRELLVMLTALFICVVPEGLPVVMVLVLVSGVYRMAKEHVLVKRLQAVEGLGRADVIMVDKTGTLTRNELMVSAIITSKQQCTISGQGYFAQGDVACAGEKKMYDTSDQDIQNMALAAVLLNATEITYDVQNRIFDIKGDPTEAAMAVCAEKLGIVDAHIKDVYKKIYEIPFDPKRKYHAGFFVHKDIGKIFVIGAPELLFSLSAESDFPVAAERLLKEGLRVIAVASGSFEPNAFDKVDIEADRSQLAQEMVQKGSLHLHGLFGIQDSIRPEVPDMVRKAHDAGLQVVMATGDHRDTALHVARNVGMYNDSDIVMTGTEFDVASDEQILSNLERITVYARLMPQQKMRLVQLFHMKKHIIAMTGDGINDAPALVAADLGIAMGGIGSEVAKEAADIILFDDSFANIIRAIAQGRHIFYTLKRVILYFFATNLGEVLIVLFALLINIFDGDFPLPLTAAQILWLNLVTDGFLDVSLSMEPQEEGLLHRSWLKKKLHLIDVALLVKIFFYAVPMAIGSLWIYMQYYQIDLRQARTMALVTMAMYQWFNAWNCRSETKSLLTIGLFSNRWLVLATSFVLFLQLVLVYAPFMQYIFKTVSLSFEQWMEIVALTAPIVLIDELRKAVVRRYS
jgi:Ca2+-transporting ATPase